MDESEIPIDIHTNKLMDWLVSRRHISKDWNKKILIIREKINEAIKDMPENKEITKLLTGSYINYFHCKKLIEILKETEANSKNLFGQYSSKRMKDWVEIVKLYEKENIYLGEVASLLQRNVNYEVPALKKQIAKMVTLKNECDKKDSNYTKTAECLLRDFNTLCKSLGIKGEKIKKELIQKASEFPKICQELSEEIKKLKATVNFYQNIYRSLLTSQKLPLGLLEYIIENGNTTVYQLKYKKIPDSVEATTLLAEEDVAENNDVIDFNIDTDINFEDDIDWGISTAETDGKESISISPALDGRNIAKGDEARTILSHPDTRNLVLNDIMELEAFLKLRLYELNSENEDLSLTVFPETLQMYDKKILNEMLKSTEIVKESLSNPTALHYLNIMTNQKYVEQLSDKLMQKLNNQEKILASKEFVKVQRTEAVNEIEALKPKVQLLIQKTKELQELIEKDISKKYKGRPVNLIGGANLL